MCFCNESHLFQSGSLSLFCHTPVGIHMSFPQCHLFPFVANFLTLSFCSAYRHLFFMHVKEDLHRGTCGCARNRPKSSAHSWHRPSSVTITRTPPSTGTLNSVPQNPPSHQQQVNKLNLTRCYLGDLQLVCVFYFLLQTSAVVIKKSEMVVCRVYLSCIEPSFLMVII